MTNLILLRASKDREQVVSSSVEHLMNSGLVMMARDFYTAALAPTSAVMQMPQELLQMAWS